jgi:hypothetical protein
MQSLRDHEETKKSSTKVGDFLFGGDSLNLHESEWNHKKISKS